MFHLGGVGTVIRGSEDTTLCVKPVSQLCVQLAFYMSVYGHDRAVHQCEHLMHFTNKSHKVSLLDLPCDL